MVGGECDGRLIEVVLFMCVSWVLRLWIWWKAVGGGALGGSTAILFLMVCGVGV